MIRELLNNLNENGVAYLIVCALSAWLGKVWAGRIARIEHQRLESELIQLKDKLEKGQKLLGGEIEKKAHVHKAQFEKEFGVYQELMKHANALRSAYFTLHMSVKPCFSSDTEAKEHEERSRKAFTNAYTLTRRTIDDNKPFYSDAVYGECENLINLSIDNLITMTAPDPAASHEETRKTKKDIVDALDHICTAIRNRLNSVAVIE